ncbi:MAG: hypothetical protein A2284_15945 [Deltaproteobacteria bacterium RIFOXYA12_FULL_61_11]|nr:MAG: hypothetical protein A2284_15945 [Deltaproteobacteria bacterium RIFOXYA12_FULL_61_11]
MPSFEKRTSQRFGLERQPAFRAELRTESAQELHGIMVDFSYEGFSCRFAGDPGLQGGDIVQAVIYYYRLPLYSGQVRVAHLGSGVLGFELLMSYHYLSSEHFDEFVTKLFEEDRAEFAG